MTHTQYIYFLVSHRSFIYVMHKSFYVHFLPTIRIYSRPS